MLRLVDNKAILYFDAPSPSDALNWYRGSSENLSAQRNTAHVRSYQPAYSCLQDLEIFFLASRHFHLFTIIIRYVSPMSSHNTTISLLKLHKEMCILDGMQKHQAT